MAQRHLNIEQSEAVRVLVDFEVNKFVAYLENTNGTAIVFATAFEYTTLQHNDEFSKYMDLWNLPLIVSSMAQSKI